MLSIQKRRVSSKSLTSADDRAPIEILELGYELGGIIAADNLERTSSAKQKTTTVEDIFLDWLLMADHDKAIQFSEGLSTVLPETGKNIKRVFISISNKQNAACYEALSELAKEIPQFVKRVALANFKEHYTPNLPAVCSISILPCLY